MKKMIICLAIIASITAMAGDKNKNLGKWSVERFGLRIRAYTNKKEYSLGEKIIVKFDFKHVNKDYDPRIDSDTNMPGNGLVEVNLIDIENNKHVELTEKTRERWYGPPNPFSFTRYAVPRISLVNEHIDSYNLNLTESYKLEAAGEYKFTSSRWVIVTQNDNSDSIEKKAILAIPPLFFKIINGNSENAKKREKKKVKTQKLDTKKSIRNLELETSIPWAEGIFGLKTKIYVEPTLLNGREPTVWLQIIVKNFSKELVPAIKFAPGESQELWDIELKNDTTGYCTKATSSRGYAILHGCLKQIVYRMQKILPGEEKYFKICLWRGAKGDRKGSLANSFGVSPQPEGDWTLNLKRTVFYTPDGNYNKDTTKEQIAFLKHCQKKELIFKPVHFKVINFPKIKKYIPPQVKD